MKKYISCDFHVSSESLDNIHWVTINLDSDAIIQFCLGLSLLKEQLITQLTMATYNNTFRLQLEGAQYVSSVQRAQIKKHEKNVIGLVLSIDELEFWQHFLLKYFRDGLSDVDHIDLEIDEATDSWSGLYVTLKVDKAVPSVSEEEARRRLGLS